MSAATHTLVEFVNGQPRTALGYGSSEKTRSFTRHGDAVNYRQAILDDEEFWNSRRTEEYRKPLRDIRILTVAIPNDGELQDGLYPGLLAVPAVSWS